MLLCPPRNSSAGTQDPGDRAGAILAVRAVPSASAALRWENDSPLLAAALVSLLSDQQRTTYVRAVIARAIAGICVRKRERCDKYDVPGICSTALNNVNGRRDARPWHQDSGSAQRVGLVLGKAMAASSVLCLLYIRK